LLNMKSNEIGQQTKELIGDKREMDVSWEIKEWEKTIGNHRIFISFTHYKPNLTISNRIIVYVRDKV
jgi:hypothetical protein